MRAAQSTEQGVLSAPRSLGELGEDDGGQLVTEWVLVTTFIVMPIVALIPRLLAMIHTYFERIAAVVGLPFP